MVKGKYGAYCKNKCGMNVGKAMGTVLSNTKIKSMLEEKRLFSKAHSIRSSWSSQKRNEIVLLLCVQIGLI